MDLARRELIAAAPLLGLAGVLFSHSAKAQPADPDGLYRTDDEATIIAAARAIIADDPVAVLVTLDSAGIPRARPVGVMDPAEDLTIWIGTRRASRKVGQLRQNPAATLHFGNDDLSGNFANAFYASFMGSATVHVDTATLAAHGPNEEARAFWPNFPDDYAAIRFQPRWLEVAGKGISGSRETWQPQAVVVRR